MQQGELEEKAATKRTERSLSCKGKSLHEYALASRRARSQSAPVIPPPNTALHIAGYRLINHNCLFGNAIEGKVLSAKLSDEAKGMKK